MDIFLRGMKEVFNPKRVWDELKSLDINEKLLLFFMIFSVFLAFIFDSNGSGGLLGFITGVFTIVNLILIARGKLTNYLWGIGSCVSWLFVAVNNLLVGDIISQSFHLMMQFVGIYAWEKVMEHASTTEIEPKKLSRKAAILSFVGAIVLYFAMVYISIKAGGNLVWLSSAILPASIIAQFLMTYGYSSQWIFWLTVNIINIIIWSIRLAESGSSALSMLVLNSMMFINSLYGIYVWYAIRDKMKRILNKKG
ncbi:nicotinamide riboside transporter PnuC [Floricoccus tropicus]|nr:nicotinamide riboside transporter PnuC [Floricoccus tropicus]